MNRVGLKNDVALDHGAIELVASFQPEASPDLKGNYQLSLTRQSGLIHDQILLVLPEATRNINRCFPRRVSGKTRRTGVGTDPRRWVITAWMALVDKGMEGQGNGLDPVKKPSLIPLSSILCLVIPRAIKFRENGLFPPQIQGGPQMKNE